MDRQLSVLVSNPHDISHKNFASLRSYLNKASNLKLTLLDENPELKGLTGHEIYLMDSELSVQSKTTAGCFKVYRQELIRQLFYKKQFQEWIQDSTIEDQILVEKASQNYPETLGRSVRLADFWMSKLRSIICPEKYDLVIIFNGASIFQRSCIEICIEKSIDYLVVESTLTGDIGVLEVGGKLDLDFAAITDYNNEKSETRGYEWMRNRASLPVNNKNVKVPRPIEESAFARFEMGVPYVLIVGQVPIDSSLTSVSPFLSAPHTYQRAIDLMVSESDLNIVFAPHPWEKQKAGFEITELIMRQHNEDHLASGRLALVSDVSTQTLIRTAQSILHIDSQIAIQAAALELPCATIGDFLQNEKTRNEVYEGKLKCENFDTALHRRFEAVVRQELSAMEDWKHIFGRELGTEKPFRGISSSNPVPKPVRMAVRNIARRFLPVIKRVYEKYFEA